MFFERISYGKSIFWDNWAKNISKSSHLSGQYAGLSLIFLPIKILVDIERRNCYANGSLCASSETSFQGLASKSRCPSIRKHGVVVIIIFNSIIFNSNIISISFYERAICREIFSKYFFASIFVNFSKTLAAHQDTFRKVLESSQKYARGDVLC